MIKNVTLARLVTYLGEVALALRYPILATNLITLQFYLVFLSGLGVEVGSEPPKLKYHPLNASNVHWPNRLMQLIHFFFPFRKVIKWESNKWRRKAHLLMHWCFEKPIWNFLKSNKDNSEAIEKGVKTILYHFQALMRTRNTIISLNVKHHGLNFRLINTVEDTHIDQLKTQHQMPNVFEKFRNHGFLEFWKNNMSLKPNEAYYDFLLRFCT